MENQRLMLAALLSVAIVLVWQVIFPPPPPVRAPTEVNEAIPGESDPGSSGSGEGEARPAGEAGSAAETQIVESPSQPAVVVERIAAETEQEIVVETEKMTAVFTNSGAQLLSYRINSQKDEEGEPFELVRLRGQDLFPFALVFGDRGTPLNKALFVHEMTEDAESNTVLTFRHSSDAGVAEKVFRWDDRGFMHVEVDVDDGGWGVVLGPGLANEKERGGYSQFLDRAVGYQRGDDFETVKADKLKSDEVLSAGGLDWVAIENNFFLVGVVPRSGVEDIRIRPILQREELNEEKPRFLPIDTSSSEDGLKAELLVVLEADHDHASFTTYFGSKRYSYLSSLPYGFERTVRWGSFIGVLAKPLYLMLGWIYENVISNYGWAIVLVTLIIRLVFFPLTHKSQKSMTKMQELNPKVQAIRNKFRNKLKDKQGRPRPDMQRQMNEEVMAVYKNAGVNPAAGCLPILLQMPVFFAFYRLLTTSVELRGAEWLLWIKDLSQPDPYMLPLPLLMGATSILVQRMTPAPPDPMQRRLMQMMPIMFTAFAIYFPSGLVVYWTTNNLLTMCQQGLINRMKNR